MREAILHWLGQDFIVLSGEAPPGSGNDAEAQTRALFATFGGALKRRGMSLADTVRSRLYGRNRALAPGKLVEDEITATRDG